MADEAIDEAKQTVEDVGGNGSDSLAKKILIPAAAGVGTLAVTVAARKAPELVRTHLMPKLEERGGEAAANLGKKAASGLGGGSGVLGAVAGKAGGMLGGGGGGGGGGGREKTRRLPIQRWTDIAVPRETAFEHWTNFEEFPKFMHRVLNVEQKDAKHLVWEEKIWFSKRRWEGEITDSRKNDRIAWKTTKGTAHAGIVSFHKLDENLTRVMVTVDFRPSGMVEKLASGLRFAKRAVEADLARFKAFVEMADAKELEYRQVRDEGDGDDSETETNGSRASSSSDGSASREERAERREQRRG